jgi:thiamine-phosphate diphosphorylase
LKFDLPKIYPITDRSLSALSHAEQTRRFVSAGASLIQLREKSDDIRLFYDDAATAIKIGREANALILINDRVDIALMTGADGVHLGQEDLPAVEARKLLGPKAIIGVSTHSVEQAKRAIKLPVDYIAAGPIFGTLTKLDHEPAIGLAGLRKIRDAVDDFPLVAIGGIKPDDIASLLNSGADSVALIGALYHGNDGIGTRFEYLRSLADRINNVANG